jgi:spore maturation protein CgeB
MIKFFRATAFYPEFLNSFYDKESKNLLKTSYIEHITKINNKLFWESNFFKYNLEKLGNYEVEEVVCNDKLLQIKWANENNILFNEENWYFDILEAQLNKFRPNVFYAYDHKILNETFLSKIKTAIPELKLLIIWDGINANKYELFSKADIVLTPADFITDNLNNNKIKAYTLPFAFEPRILDRLTKNSEKSNVSFVGQISLIENGHFARRKLLSEVSKLIDIELYLSGNTKIANQPFSRLTASLIKSVGLKETLEIFQLGKKSRGALFGIDMYNKFHNSKIVLNKHIDLAGDNAANIRLFEATGSGACLLTDYKKNISDFFEVGKEVIVYKDFDDCIKQIKYLLENPDEANKIAEAGQKRTLNNYNYANRMLFLNNIIKKHIS